MYQPRQQIGRTASTFMPSWANEGRNIPTPGMSFYPILPMSMEQEIKRAGDKRRASEKKVTAYKKRGNRRFVGGMSKGEWVGTLKPEDRKMYPHFLEDDKIENLSMDIVSDRIARINENRYEEEEFINTHKNDLRRLELNRKYRSGTDRFLPDEYPVDLRPETKDYADDAKKFFARLGLSDEWKKVHGNLYTNIYDKKGALQSARKGAKRFANVDDLLGDNLWMKTRESKEDRMNKAVARAMDADTEHPMSIKRKAPSPSNPAKRPPMAEAMMQVQRAIEKGL